MKVGWILFLFPWHAFLFRSFFYWHSNWRCECQEQDEKQTCWLSYRSQACGQYNCRPSWEWLKFLPQSVPSRHTTLGLRQVGPSVAHPSPSLPVLFSLLLTSAFFVLQSGAAGTAFKRKIDDTSFCFASSASKVLLSDFLIHIQESVNEKERRKWGRRSFLDSLGEERGKRRHKLLKTYKSGAV